MVTAVKARSPIHEIISFLSSPPPHFLTLEEAEAYILSQLLERPSYASELLAAINGLPKTKVSDTILWKALAALESAGIIYHLETVKGVGAGRPHKTYAIADTHLGSAVKIAALWQKHLGLINV